MHAGTTAALNLRGLSSETSNSPGSASWPAVTGLWMRARCQSTVPSSSTCRTDTNGTSPARRVRRLPSKCRIVRASKPPASLSEARATSASSSRVEASRHVISANRLLATCPDGRQEYGSVTNCRISVVSPGRSSPFGSRAGEPLLMTNPTWSARARNTYFFGSDADLRRKVTLVFAVVPAGAKVTAGRLITPSTLSGRSSRASSRRSCRIARPSPTPSGRMIPATPPGARSSTHRATNASAGSIRGDPANFGMYKAARSIPSAESYFLSPNGGLVRINENSPHRRDTCRSVIESPTTNTSGAPTPAAMRFTRAIATDDADWSAPNSRRPFSSQFS